MSTLSLSSRVASRAASLTRLARSAPLMPTVPRAMLSRSTSSASGMLRVWTLRISSRPLLGRPVDGDVAVEPARAEQGGVEHVGPVGRGQDDDALVGREAVHLGEDLVERLLALVVAAAEAGAADPADGVDLVDEQDAGAVLLGRLEHVADPAGADADEHLDELGAARSRRTARPPRRRRPGPAASCPCRAGRSAARPWGSGRRAAGTSPGS